MYIGIMKMFKFKYFWLHQIDGQNYKHPCPVNTHT